SIGTTTPQTETITFDKDGNIFAADGSTPMYLDSTGNLTKNTAGNPPVATLEKLAASMTIGAGTAVTTPGGTFGDGDGLGAVATSTFAFGPLKQGESIEFDGRTLTATGDMDGAQVAQAFVDQYSAGGDATIGTAGAAGSYSMTGTAGGNWTASTDVGN